MRTEITKVKTRGKAKASHSWFDEKSGKHIPINPDKPASYNQLKLATTRHFDIHHDSGTYKHSDGSVVSQETWNQRRGLLSALYSQTKEGVAISAVDVQKWIETKKVPAKFVKMIDVKPVKKAKAKKSKKATTELPSAKSMIDALKALGLDVVKASK